MLEAVLAIMQRQRSLVDDEPGPMISTDICMVLMVSL